MLFKFVEIIDEDDGTFLLTTLQDNIKKLEKVSPVFGWRFAENSHQPHNPRIGKNKSRLVMERHGEQLTVVWTRDGWQKMLFTNRAGQAYNFFGYHEK